MFPHISLTWRVSYLQTSSLLAADNHLTEDERTHFCQEILNFANQQTEGQGETGFKYLTIKLQLQYVSFFFHPSKERVFVIIAYFLLHM